MHIFCHVKIGLWVPVVVSSLGKHINLIVKVQRYFTKHIVGMLDLQYNDILHHMRVYSLQGTRERYCIIYAWKKMEGIVQNFSISCTLLTVEEVLCSIICKGWPIRKFCCQ